MSAHNKDGLTVRTVLSVGLHGELDKPVRIKLGLDDDRTLPVQAWSVRNGELWLVLDDEHDYFPVGRYVMGAPGRKAMRTHTEHKARGMFATPAEREQDDDTLTGVLSRSGNPQPSNAVGPGTRGHD